MPEIIVPLHQRHGTFELQVVARDLDSFSQFARGVLLNLPNVKDPCTSFSLGEVKAGRRTAAGAPGHLAHCIMAGHSV